MSPLACYNDKQIYQETLPEAILLLLIFVPLIEYIMYTEPLVSYTASCVPIIMYGLGLFYVVYC